MTLEQLKTIIAEANYSTYPVNHIGNLKQTYIPAAEIERHYTAIDATSNLKFIQVAFSLGITPDELTRILIWQLLKNV